MERLTEWTMRFSALAAALAVGWALRGIATRPAEAPPVKLEGPTLVDRVLALEERAARAESRCWTVKAERLDVAIFPTGNLGTQRPVPAAVKAEGRGP
jgi:hypothetical protein